MTVLTRPTSVKNWPLFTCILRVFCDDTLFLNYIFFCLQLCIIWRSASSCPRSWVNSYSLLIHIKRKSVKKLLVTSLYFRLVSRSYLQATQNFQIFGFLKNDRSSTLISLIDGLWNKLVTNRIYITKAY